jgi:AmmeMemoRadiSam system protein A
MLSDEDRRALLVIARDAVTSAAERRRYALPQDLSPALRAPGAAFVTCKTRDGDLRGCIGQVAAVAPLADTVAKMAEAASQRDPRFAPVRRDELQGLRLEVSVMTDPVPIPPDEVTVGVHGLVVERGPARGLLLPQVPVEHHWDRETFLAHTCLKAGLRPDAWREPGTVLLGFTAEVFGEAD